MTTESPAELSAIATIAAAYFSNHMTDVSKVGDVVSQIRKALAEPAVAEAAEEPKREPAVPVRKSITPDFLICLEDGKRFKSLKRHLQSHYKLSPQEYRARWGLPDDYPMVAPNYSATRSQLAKDNGLGKKAA